MKVQWDGKSSRPIKIAYVIRYGNFDWLVWIPFFVHGTSNLKVTVSAKTFCVVCARLTGGLDKPFLHNFANGEANWRRVTYTDNILISTLEAL